VTGPAWVLIAASVLIAGALLFAAFWLGRRARLRSSNPAKEASLSGGWREILAKLPASARSLPVVVVMGERGAGKTRLIERAFAARTGFAGHALTARDDFRICAFAPGPVLVQEVAGELFESEGTDGLIQLHDLWQGMALEIALVVFVGPASGSPDRHANRVRRILDLLTDLRGGRAPRSCLCMTRLDETTEGFAELVSAAEAMGSDVHAPISVAGAEELRAVWEDRFRDCYYAALAGLPSAEFARAAQFPVQSGPELARYVDAVLRGVSRGRPSSGRTLVALSALPEEGSAALLGDPFAPDDAKLEDDARALGLRRALRSTAFAAAVCAVITMVYAWHHARVRRAESALSAFELAASRATEVERNLTDVMTAEPEGLAALAIGDVLSPLYPPLRVAFPKRKGALVDGFVRRVRSVHIEPLTISPDRATRVYAASLLYASREGALGRAVRSDPQRWVTALGMPLGSVNRYVDFSARAYAGKLRNAEFSDHDVGAEEWRAFFEQLDAIIARGRLERAEELTELRGRASALAAAMRWAVQEPELRWLIQLLELERGKPEVEGLLGGKSAALLQAPPWVVSQREAIETVLTLVQDGEVAIPVAQGKSLRQALIDLDAIGAPPKGGAGLTAALTLDGKKREYRADVWAKILSESRSIFYLDALLRDLSEKQRSLFFVPPLAYPDVPPSPVLGRGPSASIAGIYTPAAFKTEIRGPLAVLDAKLEAARADSSQRAALKLVIQRELEAYGAGLGEALFAYLKSFRFDAGDVGLLRAYLAELASGSSWFSEFWASIAASASLDVGDAPELVPVRRAVSSFGPVTTLMTEDKGAYPNLEPYNAIIAKLLPALASEPLLETTARSGPLAERVPQVGKLGLALLDPEKPAPLKEVEDWLTKSNLLDEGLREPFRQPVRAVYEQALRAVERSVASAYTSEMRPLVIPLLSRFPFDPSARADAVPSEVQAVLGPKGSFSTLFQDLFVPVAERDQRGHFQPRKATGYRSLSLPREALDLGRWAAALGTYLWDESGAPRPVPVMVRPVPLAKIAPEAADAPTLAVLRAGSTTVAAFNQATSSKQLPVEWWTSSPAALVVEFTSLDGKSRRALSVEASGAAWRFFRLLRRGSLSYGVVRWSLDKAPNHDVAFQLLSNPWETVVPPINQDRLRVLESPSDEI
jgi:type VI secretion system protein ImpL